MWFEVWPGVKTHSTVKPLPSMTSPSARAHPARIHVAAFFDLDALFGFAGAVRAEGIGLRARPFLERLRSRRMIAVGMRDENMRDASCSPMRALQRLDMLGHIGPGIDHRHVVVAHDVDARALEGERAGIVREHARRCSGLSCTFSP